MNATNAAVKNTAETANTAADENSTNPATNGTETAEQKKTRVTLISALESGDAEGVANVLIRQGRSEADIKAFADTMKKAVPSFKTLVKAAEEQRLKDEAEAEKRRKEEEEQNRKAQELAQEAKDAAMKVMIDGLVAKGISPEVALKVAQGTFGGSTATRGSTAPKQRVKCVYKGTEYLVAVTGNNKDATKQAIADSGLEKADFIEKYKVQ